MHAVQREVGDINSLDMQKQCTSHLPSSLAEYAVVYDAMGPDRPDTLTSVNTGTQSHMHVQGRSRPAWSPLTGTLAEASQSLAHWWKQNSLEPTHRQTGMKQISLERSRFHLEPTGKLA